MNVNGYGCEQRKSYCMLRPMVAEYELFVLGVVWIVLKKIINGIVINVLMVIF